MNTLFLMLHMDCGQKYNFLCPFTDTKSKETVLYTEILVFLMMYEYKSHGNIPPSDYQTKQNFLNHQHNKRTSKHGNHPQRPHSTTSYWISTTLYTAQLLSAITRLLM
jgi:hypothetical protein